MIIVIIVIIIIINSMSLIIMIIIIIINVIITNNNNTAIPNFFCSNHTHLPTAATPIPNSQLQNPNPKPQSNAMLPKPKLAQLTTRDSVFAKLIAHAAARGRARHFPIWIGGGL